MFTMIRIMINRPYAEPRRRPQPPVEAVDHSDDVKPGNPWKQELDRLAQSGDRSGRNRFGSLPAPAGSSQGTPAPPKPSMSEGTLTNLRNWWGAGLNSGANQGTSQQNRQYPPKKINRWQQ